MITDEARSAVARLRILPRFPDTKEAAAELVRVFQQACRDSPHANRTVDELLRTMRRCPIPVDIYEAATATRRQDSGGNPTVCSKCHGTTWIGRRQGKHSYVVRCSCFMRRSA